MIVFVDFEASSLGRHGFPIEVGWAAEDGSEMGFLIRPAPGWEEWSADAERIHGIALDRLWREGAPHAAVAARMLEMLSGQALYASAPSWDGHWLSLLLRASGLPRHALRLRDTEEAQRRTADDILAMAGIAAGERAALVDAILAAAREGFETAAPAHRALADARRELRLWQNIRRRAEAAAAEARGD
ncbi:3'-5' exonuclease [Rhodopila globiformis]|uniref:Transcriptional regulator n=1 Tax=Rhodopila globiformis TaxID=1071 RepID=A0A2S6MV77_RHOGL|nr:transcriptional regulator [Rhodopila globiformis]PPQ26248.1 transcriptional regulator [Rhodopila globiformis]